MRIHHYFAALTCAILAFAMIAPAARAQEGSRGTVVAVIDLAYVFANCDMMAELNARYQEDVSAFSEEMKSLEKELIQFDEDAKNFKAGSKEYKELRADFIKKKGEAEVRNRMGQEELAELSAKNAFSVYEEMLEVLEAYCADHGVDLVLLCNGAKADTTQPESMRNRLYRQVVYYSSEIDISKDIIDLLNNETPTKPRPERVGKGGTNKLPKKPIKASR